MAAIERSIAVIMNSGVDYEFRTTVVNPLHSDGDIEKMGELIRGAKRWYLQNFVDSGGLIGGGFSPVGKERMEEMASIARRFVENVEIRGI